MQYGLAQELEDIHNMYSINYLIIMFQDLTFKMYDFKNIPFKKILFHQMYFKYFNLIVKKFKIKKKMCILLS